MNYRLFFLILPLFFTACAQEKQGKKHQAIKQVHVRYIAPGCATIPPDPEKEALRLKGEPYANYTLVLLHNEGQTQTQVTTDAKGNLNLPLAHGTYCLKQVLKTDSKVLADTLSATHAKVDSACFQKWINTCDLSFEINNNIKQIDTLRINGICKGRGPIPCVINTHLPR